MSRPNPGKPPEELKKRPQTETITQIREYKLITPLFGGGVEAGKVDKLTPIRGSAIRGHLRFWWRATRGGQFGGDLAKMKEKEDEIWGSASLKKKKGDKKRPVTVTLQILDVNKEKSGELFVFEVARHPKDTKKTQIKETKKNIVPTYAAFPLRPDQKAPLGTKSEAVHENIEFTLKITFAKEHQKDVEAALWAWGHFGGIGARTRRGFGAVQCVAIDGKSVTLDPKENIQKYFSSNIQAYANDNKKWPENVPYMKGGSSIYVTKQKGDYAKAWNFLIKGLNNFRQYKEEGDDFGANLWPESQAIRDLLRGSSQPERAKNKFPRSEFGLPINYELMHFKDLEDVVLRAKHREDDEKSLDRLASPLILRPFEWGEGAVGIALVLSGTKLPAFLHLEGKHNGKSKSVVFSSSLDEDKVKKLPPLKDNKPKKVRAKHILHIFLNYLKGLDK